VTAVTPSTHGVQCGNGIYDEHHVSRHTINLEAANAYEGRMTCNFLRSNRQDLTLAAPRRLLVAR
jgi:hypothetical protein